MVLLFTFAPLLDTAGGFIENENLSLCVILNSLTMCVAMTMKREFLYLDTGIPNCKQIVFPTT